MFGANKRRGPGREEAGPANAPWQLTSPMPVSSYIIRCADEARPAVREALSALPGVTAGPEEAGGLAVVTETADHAEAEAMEATLRAVPRVLDAVLVYHNFEDVFAPAPTANPSA